MARGGKIQVQIVGDASGLSRAFKTASRDARSFGSRVGSAIGSIAKAGAFAGIAAGVVGVTTVLRAGISEWQQQAKVASTTAAMLKSTGGIAKVTAGDIQDLAQSIMAKTGIDDEAIQSGENLLLAFTNVRNEVGKGNDIFNRATRAAVDLSSAGFGSMTSTSKQLGKALQDPIGGLGGLARAGVKFSEDQKAAIKAMVETGDTLGAQKTILDAVEGKVGGVAEAYGKTLPGQINVAKEQFNNLSGTLVSGLAPAFATALGATNNFLQKFSEAHGASDKFKVVATTIKDAAVATGEGLLRSFRSIDWTAIGRTMVDGFTRAFTLLVNSIRSIDWRSLGKSVGDFTVRELNRLGDFIRSVDWNNAGHQISEGFGRAISAFGRFLAGVDWASVLSVAFNTLVATLKGLGTLLLAIGQDIGAKLIQGMQKGAVAFWALLKLWLASLPAVIMGLFAGAGDWLLSAGKAAILGFLHGAESVFGMVLGKIQGMVAQLKEAAANLLTLGHGGGGGGRSDVGPGKDFASVGKRSTQAIEKGTESIVQVLKRRTQEVLREVNYLQRQIDKVNARREREDLASAVRNAQATLAQTRADKKATQTQIEDAERGLARAQEDIKMAARNRELTAAQAHYDKVKAQLEKANQAMLDKQQAAADAFQKVLDKARDRAATSFDRLSSLIQRGFDAVTDAWVAPSQKAIDAITNRRANEDLAEAVRDAQDRLAEAMQGDDPEAILDAQRTLARAKEDIAVASLQRQAEAETKAHDKTVASQKDALDRMLANLQTSFATTGTETDKGMASVLKIINGYLGGFQGAGKTLGGAFASSLRDAITAAVSDANDLAGTTIRNISPMPAITAPFRVPGLASGGQILRTGIALVHKGESVMPAKASGGSATINVTVHGFVGNDQDIAGRIVDTINREQRVGRMRFAT